MKKFLASLLTCVLLLGLLPTAARAADDVPYLDRHWDESTKQVITEEKYASDPTAVTDGTTTLNGRWYVVSSDVTINSRITVSGDAHLILMDGYTLTASSGISVEDTNSLTIYGQEQETGKLIAQSRPYDNAAIGGTFYRPEREHTCGSITINGGQIEATGADNAVGIGSALSHSGGNITINGGKVTAKGGKWASGIGSSPDNHTVKNFTSITINGGIVIATGSDTGAGIGGGEGKDGSDNRITINGGNITATGGENGGAGIGGGAGSARDGAAGAGGTIIITGGIVSATGGGNGAGIGGGGSAVNGKAGAGGTIIITGGTVNAVGGSGAGIGSGVNRNGGAGDSGSFSAGTTGNAIITASSISDDDDTTDWSGVIFEGNSGQVYGNSVILTTDATIPEDMTLNVEEGQTLIIGKDVTLTNRGTLTNSGEIINNGILKNNGTVDGSGNYSGTGTVDKAGQTAPGAGEGYTIDYTTETITANSGYEVSSNQDRVISPTDIPGQTLYVRKAENNFYSASDWTSFTAASQPTAPTGLQGIAVSIAGKQDGQITGVSADMEYKLSTADSWTACTGTEINGLAAGTYQVRLKATASTFASEAAPVTVPSGQVRTYTLTVNGGTGGGSYAAGATVTITATAPTGQRFTGWTVNDGGVTVPNTNPATFTMPAGNVTVTANFQSNSGGGTYTPPTYPPTVEKPSGGGGTPSTSPSNPKQGDTVTVTPKPDEGYEVDKITVTDRNGKPVEVTRKPDGAYTFQQPSGKVTIKVTYQPIDRPWNNPFTDVSEGDWYYEAVQFVQERGLMNGYGNGNFAPNAQLSRAQLAQILFNKEGRPGVNYLLDFSDVAGEAWYTEAIRWAASQGIVGGYGNGKFGPNDPITREQLAVMLWRYSGSPAAPEKELNFTDADKASSYALDALRWAVENGILNGYGNGRLDPQGQATRAQVAQMLKNFMENSTVQ